MVIPSSASDVVDSSYCVVAKGEAVVVDSLSPAFVV